MILQAMKSQTSTSPWLNRLLRPLEGLLAGMLLAIWLVVLLQVMLRYGFGISIQGANESIVLLFDSREHNIQDLEKHIDNNTLDGLENISILSQRVLAPK